MIVELIHMFFVAGAQYRFYFIQGGIEMFFYRCVCLMLGQFSAQQQGGGLRDGARLRASISGLQSEAGRRACAGTETAAAGRFRANAPIFRPNIVISRVNERRWLKKGWPRP